MTAQSKDRWVVHPLIQTARGMLTDEDYASCEAVLARAVDRAKDLEEEHERLREALDDALDLAAEGLSYTPEYFIDKWNFRTEYERLRALRAGCASGKEPTER